MSNQSRAMSVRASPGGRVGGLGGDAGSVGMWAVLALGCALVLPPFLYLIRTSLTVSRPGLPPAIGLDNYAPVAELGGLELWSVTAAYAIGAALIAVLLSAPTARLVARPNVPVRQTVFVGAILSLAQ